MLAAKQTVDVTGRKKATCALAGGSKHKAEPPLACSSRLDFHDATALASGREMSGGGASGSANKEKVRKARRSWRGRSRPYEG